MVADDQGWQWIGEYCAGIEAIMLFPVEDERTMFIFADGRVIRDVVGECFGFEFYLTNSHAEFVLCFNHHDRVIAAGGAQRWLEDVKRNRASFSS